PETFEPIKTAPVSNDYIIGPGDEIKILMWGRLDATYSLEVDNEGTINFPKIGPLTVAGLTFAEIKELIHREAEAITGVNVNVTMGRLRTIQVFVLGEVKIPGVYTVSSLATVANALILSGGPNLLGSLRDVQVKRNGRIATVIDIYDFLIKGDVSRNIRLMPGDVVFVPKVGSLVSVSGNVNRPAIYELKDRKALGTALALAGGLTPRAFNQRIQIERPFENRFQIVLDISYEELKSKTAIPLQDGDYIRVLSIMPSAVNAVFLYGNVTRPGQYAFKDGLRILDIIPDIGGLAQDTYADYALIKRYRMSDMKAELIPFDIGRLLNQRDFNQNIALQSLDEIYVFHKRMFEEKEFAQVDGEVRKPGKYMLDDMKIRDVIRKAGDLTPEAYQSKAELIRIDSDRILRTIYFDLARAMADDPGHNLWVQDEDRIVVHSIWEKQWREAVTIEGEIKNVGEYLITSGMRLKDLFFKAGQFTRDAYLELGHLYRTDGKTKEVTIQTFNVDKALSEDPAHNLILQDQDNVVIHSIWEYREQYMVTINGLVNNPDDYPFASNMTIRDLILVAGNVKDAAYLQKAELVRFDIVGGNRVETSVLNFNVIKVLENDSIHNLKLQPLDVVTIKEIPQWWDKKKTVTIKGEVFFPGTYPIRRDEHLSSIIERAGGFTDEAYYRGAFFSRESVRMVQQQRIDDMVSKLEAESARLSSEEIQGALNPEDVAAHVQFVTAQKALIAKLKEARATGRVVMNVQPLSVLKGSSSDITLEDGDTLMVPQKPNTVNVLGSVYNPTSLIYDEKHPELKFYLGLTGGPTVNAEEKSIYVVRANGSVVSKQGGSSNINWDETENRWAFGGKFADIKLYPGDTILVPEKIVKPNYMKEIKDLTQILYQIAIAAGITIALF
ncbi:SLBB domain-containing protein, partial [Thermodesulfobacteriota bacterium]